MHIFSNFLYPLVMQFKCWSVPESRNITIYISKCKLCFLQMSLQSLLFPCVRICDAVHSVSSSLCQVSGCGSGIGMYVFILCIWVWVLLWIVVIWFSVVHFLCQMAMIKLLYIQSKFSSDTMMTLYWRLEECKLTNCGAQETSLDWLIFVIIYIYTKC